MIIPSSKKSAAQRFTFSFAILLVFAFSTFFKSGTLSAAEPLAAKTLAASAVDLEVSFDDAKNHYANIKVSFDVSKDQASVELMMPVWTPGSYLVREFTRHIETITATSNTGVSLPVAKSRKNRWAVQTKGAERVTVAYQVYCREMSVRTNWVDSEYAILNGAPTFMTPVDSLKSKHNLKIKLPEGWKKAICALPSSENGTLFSAANYDEIVDSPIFCGNPDIQTFEVGGVEHWLVSVGGDNLWDFKKAAQDTKKIVETQQKLWGSVPYSRYIFFNMLTESGGGLEHDNSTLMMSSRWSFRKQSSYKRWLGLVSHEFFHTWNIRRLRPKQLVEYDYENENYFTTLWIAEGITSYYDDLCVARAGLYDQKQYLSNMSRQIASVQSAPGRGAQSLKDSSYDTWIKYYRPDENSKNSQISYYTKGAIVGFLLDAKIRELTEGKKSLDDVMQIMFTKYANGVGYTPTDFRSVVDEVAGEDMAEFFANAVDSTNELNFQPALDYYGLTFDASTTSAKKPKPDAKKKDAATPEKKKAGKVWLGMDTTSEGSNLIVSRVLKSSSAFNAGVNVDDELVALDEFRITSRNWSSQLEQFKPGEKHKLLIVRRGKLIHLDIEFVEEPKEKWTLKLVKKPTALQKTNLKNLLWLSEKSKKDSDTTAKKKETKAN